jgi:hypothetical protein
MGGSVTGEQKEKLARGSIRWEIETLSRLDRFSIHLLRHLATPNWKGLGCSIVPGCHVCFFYSLLDRVFPHYLPTMIVHHSDTELDLLRWVANPSVWPTMALLTCSVRANVLAPAEK